MNKMKVTFVMALVFFISGVFAEDFSAKLDWSERTELGLLSSGVINRILVKPGQKINKGDLLLTLDKREFNALEKRAKANVARAKERYAEAVREFERSEELYDRQVLSDRGRQLVSIEKLESEAVLEEAQANLLIAKIDKERSQLKAPFNGVIVELMASIGTAINNNLTVKPLVVIANNQKMHAVAQLTNEQMSQFKLGMKMNVTVKNTFFEGTVVELGLEPVNDYYILKVSFANKGIVDFRKGEKAMVGLK